MNQLDPEKLVELAGRIRSIGDRIGTVNRMAKAAEALEYPVSEKIYRLACQYCDDDYSGYTSDELRPLFAGFVRAGLQAESDRLRAEMAEVAREIGGAAQPTPLPGVPSDDRPAAESAAADDIPIVTPFVDPRMTSASANHLGVRGPE